MKAGKATKKLIPIDWFEWTGDYNELFNWLDLFNDDFDNHFLTEGENLKVKTLEGTSYSVPENYIIIRGIKGEYYPCAADVFENSYDRL
jgi:hypothetical protein